MQACDGRTDGQNYDFQDGASIAARAVQTAFMVITFMVIIFDASHASENIIKVTSWNVFSYTVDISI